VLVVVVRFVVGERSGVGHFGWVAAVLGKGSVVRQARWRDGWECGEGVPRLVRLYTPQARYPYRNISVPGVLLSTRCCNSSHESVPGEIRVRKWARWIQISRLDWAVDILCGGRFRDCHPKIQPDFGRQRGDLDRFTSAKSMTCRSE
jgi:hypothetical protein